VEAVVLHMTRLTLDAALNIALQHHGAGRLREAEDVYRQVLAQVPRHPDALHLLGVLSQQQGRGEDALRLIRSAIEISPGVARFHANLGNVLREQGRLDQAIDAYRQSAKLAPDVAPTQAALGEALLAAGRVEEAVETLTRASALQPRPETWLNLGLALRHMGRLDEAVDALAACLKLNPNEPAAHANLGMIFHQRQELARAAAAFTKVTELTPTDAVAFMELGSVLTDMYRLEESVRASRRAIELAPHTLGAQSNLAQTLTRQGRVRKAVEVARRAVALPPAIPAVHSNLLLELHYDHTATPQEIFAEHLRFAERFGPRPDSALPQEYPNDRFPDRRLRVGYVSPDFRSHPVAYFVEPLLAQHDPARVEVFCYAHDFRPDEVTQRLRELNVTWREIQDLDDSAAARLVRDDQIDVLVDLAGHTAHSRLLVLGERPAPVQVTYLGYPNTTGLREVDYRLTDAFADPPGEADALSVERLVRLPWSAWCYAPPGEAPGVNDDPPARRTGRVTFASFNAIPKINPPTIELWARLLHRVAGSRLLLKAVAFIDDATARRIAGEFAAHGIGADRLELRKPQSAMADHFASYHDVDVALDPSPYNGTTTTCEALWMGVPVVTIAGRTHASRVGVSMLSNVGLPELIAKSSDDFLDVASKLAGDLDRLAALRAGLRARMRASPLMEAQGFARDVEHAYRAMWKEWCRR
jgi:protein O-GlcNAc transferase